MGDVFDVPRGWKYLSEGTKPDPRDLPESLRHRWAPVIEPIPDELMEEWIDFANKLCDARNRGMSSHREKWHIEFERDEYDYDWFMRICPFDKEYMFQLGRLTICISKY